MIASALGTLGVFASFGIFWIARDYLGLAPKMVQSVVFLKLLVAGHMTIYLTRNKGTIWERPLPSLKLIIPCETTQILGTFAGVYGWFMTPIGWRLALLVWGYSLAFFMIGSVVKILTYRLLDNRAMWEANHLALIEHHPK